MGFCRITPKGDSSTRLEVWRDFHILQPRDSSSGSCLLWRQRAEVRLRRFRTAATRLGIVSLLGVVTFSCFSRALEHASCTYNSIKTIACGDERQRAFPEKLNSKLMLYHAKITWSSVWTDDAVILMTILKKSKFFLRATYNTLSSPFWAGGIRATPARVGGRPAYQR